MKNRIFNLALAVSAFAFASCNNSAKEAEQSIRDFGSLTAKKDFAGARGKLTKASHDIWDIAVEMVGDSLAAEGSKMDKQKITCNMKGEKGVCVSCCNSAGKADSIYMKKEDGAWKIDLAADPRMADAKAAIEKAGGKEKLMEQMKAMKKMIEEMKNMSSDSSALEEGMNKAEEKMKELENK